MLEAPLITLVKKKRLIQKSFDQNDNEIKQKACQNHCSNRKIKAEVLFLYTYISR